MSFILQIFLSENLYKAGPSQFAIALLDSVYARRWFGLLFLYPFCVLAHLLALT